MGFPDKDTDTAKPPLARTRSSLHLATPQFHPAMDIYAGIDITKASAADKPEIYAVAQWVRECSAQANRHGQKAKRLKFQSVVLSFLALLGSSCSAVSSGISAEYQNDKLWLFMALCFAALSTVCTGLGTILNPASRRAQHLSSETMYNHLGRDMSVFLTTTDPSKLSDRQVTWDAALHEFQRRMDNVDSLAPPL